MKSVDRDQLLQLLNETLDPNRMADYCPNGLQVEGKSQISKVITGVTASKALLELAVSRNADAVIVHHGLMWKGDPMTVSGFRKERLACVLSANLNVFAYHLPLDKHPELGNNVQLGRILGWSTYEIIGSKGLIHRGVLDKPCKLSEVVTVYEGGKFYYYASPSDLPCHGPLCQKRDSKESLSIAVPTVRTRSVQVVKPEIEIELPIVMTRLDHSQDRLRITGFVSDIFRPPRSV